MKILLLNMIFVFFSIGVLVQTTYQGILQHTSSYLRIFPYSPTYDDGSHARLFYDGNKKEIRFWNSASGTDFTNLTVGSIFSDGFVIGSLQHLNGYFVIKAYDPSYDDGSQARIFYDGNTRRLNFWNSDNTKVYTDINAGNFYSHGKVHAEEVKVDLSVPGPDYVFEEDYDLPTLESIKQYVKQNKHLPEVPSAKEMEEKGIDLGVMNMLLLKKVEELTLHLIEQDRVNKAQAEEIAELKKLIKKE